MARRVNKRFLSILSLAVVGGAVLLLVMDRLTRREDPSKLLAAAQKAEQEGNYDLAVEKIWAASALRSSDTELAVQAGDLCWRASRVNGEYTLRAIKKWQAALEIEPTHKGAIERLFRAYLDAVEIQPQPDFYAELGKWATQLAAVDKTNAEAEAWQHLAVVGAWASESSRTERSLAPVTPAKRDAAIARLLEFMKGRSNVTMVPYLVARAYVKMGNDRGTSDRLGAAEFYNKARKLMEQAAAANPESSALRYRQFQIVAEIPVTDTSSEALRARAEAIKQSIDEALRLAQKTDPDYLNIRLAAVRYQVVSGDKAAALEQLRAMAKEFPDDGNVRITLAIALRDAGQVGEALELLSKPLAEDKTLMGYKLGQRVITDRLRLVELARTHIVSYFSTTDETVRQQTPGMLSQTCQSLAATGMPTEDPLLLELRGIALLLEGQKLQTVTAVQMLQKSYDASVARGEINQMRALWLVKAYKEAWQWGAAMNVVTQALQRRPTLELHLERLQLLLREHRVEEFRQELKDAEKLAPDNLDIKRYKLLTFDPSRDKDQILKTLANLPEDTDAARLQKAYAAIGFGQSEMAEQLLTKLLGSDKQSTQAARLLVQIYVKNKQRDKAQAMLRDLLTKKPNKDLKLLQTALEENRTPEAIVKMTQDALDSVADPVERALSQYGYARQRNQMDEAKGYLDEAAKQAPDDGRVLNAFFNWYTEKKQWDEAAKVVDKLALLSFDQAGGLHYRYELAMRQGKPAEALQFATQLVKTQKEFAQSYMSMARAQMAMGMYDLAKENYGQGLDRQSNNPEALRGLAECCQYLSQYDEMRKYLERAVRQFPTDWTFADMLLKFEEEYGEPSRAVPVREELAKKAPDQLYHQVALARAYWRLGRSRKSEPAGAALQYDKAWQTLHATRAKPQWTDEIVLYDLLAEVAADRGRVDDGISAFNQLAAREKWSDKAEPYLRMGSYCRRFNRVDEAETAFKRAIAKNPSADTRASLAQFYLITPQIPDHLQKSIDIMSQVYQESRDERVRRLLLRTQVQANRLDDAARGLEAALADHKNDPDLLTTRADLALRSKPARPADASRDLDQAIAIDPRNVRALRLRADLRMTGGKPKDALDDLDQAVRLAPADPEAHVAYSRALLSVGREDPAIQEAETALRLQPQSRDTRLMLIQMCRTRMVSRAVDLASEAQKLAGLSNDPIWLVIESDLLQSGNPELALKKIQDAQRLAPGDPALALREAELCLVLKNPPAANQALDRAARLGAERDYRLPMLRGMARAALGQKEQAITDFGSAMALAGDDSAAERVLSRLESTVGVSAAVVAAEKRIADGDPRWKTLVAPLYLKDKQAEKAVRTINAVVRADEFKSQPPGQRLAALSIAARVYTETGAQDNYKSAIWAYEEILRLGSQQADLMDELDFAFVQNNYACVLGELVRPPDRKRAMELATKAYEVVRGLGPHRVDVARRATILDTYGWMLVCTGEAKRALSPLSEAAQNDVASIEIPYHLTMAHIAMRRPELAQPRLTQVLDLIKQREDAGNPVDADLKTKVAGAQAALEELMKGKNK